MNKPQKWIVVYKVTDAKVPEIVYFKEARTARALVLILKDNPKISFVLRAKVWED